MDGTEREDWVPEETAEELKARAGHNFDAEYEEDPATGITFVGVSPVNGFQYGIDEDSGCIIRRRDSSSPWRWEAPGIQWLKRWAESLGLPAPKEAETA